MMINKKQEKKYISTMFVTTNQNILRSSWSWFPLSCPGPSTWWAAAAIPWPSPPPSALPLPAATPAGQGG